MNKEEKNSNKCPICGRPTHKESKHCIFHASAKEKTEKEFKKALKEYIQEIKEKNKYCNFGRFIFIGEIDFKEDLNINIFKETNFLRATFDGDTSFWGATFEGYADFRQVIFKRDAIFWKATFEGDIDFSGATFEGDIDFSGATFEGDIDFKVKHFVKSINFSRVSILSVNKLNLKSENNEGIISFERACLENAYLDIELGKDVLIDFSDALLKNTMVKKRQIENHILQEKKKNYSEAQQVFLLLKNNFHSIGRYNDESWAYIKEKDMEKLSYSFANPEKTTILMRLTNKIYQDTSNKKNIFYRFILRIKSFIKWFFSKKFLNWFNLTISSFIYGYGERPWKVIRFASIAIVLFALIFNRYGIITTSYKLNFLEEYLRKTESNGYILKYLGSISGNFWNCLYFSVITFTTLGYGDFQPLEGWSRFFAGSEAFIGAFMMALFVYTFARRTGGR